MFFILPDGLDDENKIGIFFKKEDKKIPKELNRIKLSKWLQEIIHAESHQLGTIYFHYCSDESLSVLNKKHLNHNTLTDIISFQYSNLPLDGDIYISVDRAEENALNLNHSTFHELLRLHAHGILHFCGFKDGNKSEKKLMREKENYYLSLYPGA
jgi:probable rRNA maturation factor